ncbi:UDP-3-O-acyl-N-acetylglucosamine deacetylase [Candidatus Gracilibacteria bacterium]|nr:UDP-3-O-acyl-N-acetylglucosamine deacetylase [Candidatus Gracilibacteria bacterium]NJM88720.1 UDP-3-O-acyl-N-acetylglucosamine deacetylase [Hydrococcus sp. RU_2_2]NJP21930.1 UDP-3-O-acyl-N-acetylglucosamine deacetylase [Hydrococcus sp. CRU_1_1]
MEYTIKESFALSGIGLHSGVKTQVRVIPANPGEGRYFVRVDLPEQPIIRANVDAVRQTTLSTELATDGGAVRTVEHLLAALIASGIDNARLEIDGAEVPLLDGSAKNWTDAIASVGITSPSPCLPVSPSPRLPVSPVWIQDGDAFVAALPASEIRFTYGIDFSYAAIGNQWYSWNPKLESFANAIAPARTFGFADQIEQLQQAGLIKGGSLENALVCDESGWLNPPLRFANEPVRHKLLDLVGDLSLLGKIPIAHFLAYKASHKLHIQLAKALRKIET